MVKVGDAAPDFTLMGAGFETTTLSSLKGSKVVLAFFPAAFSGDADGGCQCQVRIGAFPNPDTLSTAPGRVHY